MGKPKLFWIRPMIFVSAIVFFIFIIVAPRTTSRVADHPTLQYPTLQATWDTEFLRVEDKTGPYAEIMRLGYRTYRVFRFRPKQWSARSVIFRFQINGVFEKIEVIHAKPGDTENEAPEIAHSLMIRPADSDQGHWFALVTSNEQTKERVSRIRKQAEQMAQGSIRTVKSYYTFGIHEIELGHEI